MRRRGNEGKKMNKFDNNAPLITNNIYIRESAIKKIK